MPLTMADISQAYITEHVIPCGIDLYRTRLTFKTLFEFFGLEFRVKRLERQHSRDYRAHRKAQGVCDATVRRELCLLRAAVNHAFKEGRLKTMPFVELPPPSPPRERFYEEEEMRAVFTEAKRRMDASPPRLIELHRRSWYFLWLASETWARAGAIEQLTVGRVDLWRRRMVDYRVPGMRVTKKRRGEVAISDALWPVLYEAIHRWGPPWKDDLVIGPGLPRPRKNLPYEPGKMRPYSTTYPAISAITHAAGIKERFVARHVWRKTGASHCVMNGGGIEAAAAVLHDTIPTTSTHYAKFRTDRTFAAVNAKPVPILLPAFERIVHEVDAPSVPLPCPPPGDLVQRPEAGAAPH
jgi:integrase